MAVGANTYGSVVGVEGLAGDVVASRDFTGSTVPTTTQVELYLDQIAARLNAMLKAAGYTVPVVTGDDPEAFTWLAMANNAGASAKVLEMFPGGSYSRNNPEAMNSRAQSLANEVTTILEAIKERTFPATFTTAAFARIYAGSQEDSSGKTKLPVFTRAITDYPSSVSRVD
tara:strand:- start:79 stop:591 length:513 start_codon:yes stop_codon:yes gene_type:complete